MKNKYYIPDPNEFYIGFEYERINDLTKKHTSTFFKDGESAEFLLSEESYKTRVKFLDKNDIETLSWAYDNDNDYFVKVKKNTSGYFKVEFILSLYKDNMVRISQCVATYEDVLFFGKIKNKNELLKISQQLDIS